MYVYLNESIKYGTSTCTCTSMLVSVCHILISHAEMAMVNLQHQNSLRILLVYCYYSMYICAHGYC